MAASTVSVIATAGVNFGAVPVATTTPPTLTLYFTFTAGGYLGSLPAVLTQGTTGLDFADAGTGTCTTNGTTHTYAAGDTCTVDLTFVPQLPGARNGAVVVLLSVNVPTNCDRTLSAMPSVASLGLPWLRMLKASTLL